MSLYLVMFLAGLLTILLPCILPLIPIVLGVSIVGRNKWRPLFTVLGMIISFVGFTFLLTVVLNQFVELADYIRIGTFYALLLFGIGFAIHQPFIASLGAVLGALFFIDKGPTAVVAAALIGVGLLFVGEKIATKIQQFGSDVQVKARGEFGSDSPLTAFIIGLTLGLVWVPCAGPALGFALTLVRDKPGIEAALALTAYALGTGLPLILIGYGGQAMTQRVRAITKYSGYIKTVAGFLLIVTAVALRFDLFMDLQVWLASNTKFGDIGTQIEEQLIGDRFNPNASSSSSSSTDFMNLPLIVRAPEFTGLGPWHNSEPFTLASLRGKVVLIDFWTYSCINCIRTLPYIEGYWDTYKDTGKFVLLGVHTPEFTFEKSEKNVAAAIKNHGLTYPVAQDNEFGTLRAFANQYWPAKYLIDANGYIRYTHFGEGEYEQTDKAIASLLNEAGVTMTGGSVSSASSSEGASGLVSPETYVGTRSWPAFGNSAGEPDLSAHMYTAPETLDINKYYLDGTWKLSADQQYQELTSESGEIRMQFRGGEMNLVLGLADGAKSVEGEIIVDGTASKTITISMHDLYNLFKGDYGQHDVILKLKGKGVQAFAFTFGG